MNTHYFEHNRTSLHTVVHFKYIYYALISRFKKIQIIGYPILKIQIDNYAFQFNEFDKPFKGSAT